MEIVATILNVGSTISTVAQTGITAKNLKTKQWDDVNYLLKSGDIIADKSNQLLGGANDVTSYLYNKDELKMEENTEENNNNIISNNNNNNNNNLNILNAENNDSENKIDKDLRACAEQINQILNILETSSVCHHTYKTHVFLFFSICVFLFNFVCFL